MATATINLFMFIASQGRLPAQAPPLIVRGNGKRNSRWLLSREKEGKAAACDTRKSVPGERQIKGRMGYQLTRRASVLMPRATGAISSPV